MKFVQKTDPKQPVFQQSVTFLHKNQEIHIGQNYSDLENEGSFNWRRHFKLENSIFYLLLSYICLDFKVQIFSSVIL